MVDLVGEDIEVEEREGTKEEGEEEGINEETSRQKETTSNVWEHFTREKVYGKFKAQCHHCGKLYLGDSSEGTTHLHNHLA